MKVKRSALFYPVFFMIRRLSLAIISIYVYEQIWLQLITQYEMTVLQLGYLIYFKPFDGSLA